MEHHLSAEEHTEFNVLFDALERELGYQAERDTFMIEPLRYTQSVLYSIGLSRTTIRKQLERAFFNLELSYTYNKKGKGVYLQDNYAVGKFIVRIMNARRGGRVICFAYTSTLEH